MNMKMFVFVCGRSIIYLKVAQIFCLFLCSSMYCCWKNTRLHTFLFVWPMCKIPYWNRGSTGHILYSERGVVFPCFYNAVCWPGLPDEAGRVQILEIHTAKMRENNLLAPDVDLADLAVQTKNFTGAEIEGLVRAAQSTAMNRFIQVQ